VVHVGVRRPVIHTSPLTTLVSSNRS
jgi:hypothetical protein